MNGNERVLIVGAGMAGLCSGLYLRMNGFEVEILEAHDAPGGLCTAWHREGYTVDGCIHWLLGSGEGTPMHRVWRELIDLDAVSFVNHDHLFDLEVGVPDARGDTFFHLYADLDRQERYLLEAAPEDAREIRRWLGVARRFVGAPVPPVQTPREARTWRDLLPLLGMVPLLPTLKRWSGITAQRYAQRFRSPFMRALFDRIFAGADASMLVLMLQQAWYHRRCAGYPVGGSLAFARRFESRFLELGGTLRYRSPVAAILEEAGSAVGVRLTDGTEVRADVVVSAADGRWTLYEALGGRHLTPALEDLYAERKMPTFPSLVYVSLGVRGGLDLPCHQVRYRLAEPWILPDGTKVEQLPVHAYDYDPTLAPPGSTLVTLMLESREFEYWSRLRAGDLPAYRAAKKEVADGVIRLLAERLGADLRDRVEMVDVATPATFHRYTRNWKGSYEGWLPVGDFLSLPKIPRELPGLRNFHMVGQWVEPGGGLPPAALHGRELAQLLCARTGRPFTIRPPGPQARAA